MINIQMALHHVQSVYLYDYCDMNKLLTKMWLERGAYNKKRGMSRMSTIAIENNNINITIIPSVEKYLEIRPRAAIFVIIFIIFSSKSLVARAREIVFNEILHTV